MRIGRHPDSKPAPDLSRRTVITSGIGVVAFMAVPDVARATTTASTRSTSGYFYLYGLTETATTGGARVQAFGSPAVRNAAIPSPVSIQTGLSATPVLSPDQAWLALVTTEMSAAGAHLTISVVEKSTALVKNQIELLLPGIATDASVLVTPVFSPGADVVSLVIAISEPSDWKVGRKAATNGQGSRMIRTATWRSRHALAYYDRRTGSLAGPFYLGEEPSLALTTAVSTGTDLFIWNTRNSRALGLTKGNSSGPTFPTVRAFPLGAGKAKFTAISPQPWPGGEPAVALSTGDAARLVNSRTLQVCSAANGDVTEVALSPLSMTRAKITPVTVTPRPDGTLFLAKPSVGRAIVVDPAREFTVTTDVSFPVPSKPAGGPESKAVLSADGTRLYVLGGANAGGLSSYDTTTGSLAASYSRGEHYTGLYQLPSGTLLALSMTNPRLSYFSPELDLLTTADASLFVSTVY